jgi:hypothetical protein
MASINDMWWQVLTNGLFSQIAAGAQPVSTTGTNTAVVVPATTTTTALAAGTRAGGTFQNSTGSTVLLLLGNGASATSYTISLANGAYYELPFRYSGPVSVFSTTASVAPHLLVTSLA